MICVVFSILFMLLTLTPSTCTAVMLTAVPSILCVPYTDTSVTIWTYDMNYRRNSYMIISPGYIMLLVIISNPCSSCIMFPYSSNHLYCFSFTILFIVIYTFPFVLSFLLYFFKKQKCFDLILIFILIYALCKLNSIDLLLIARISTKGIYVIWYITVPDHKYCRSLEQRPRS
jgi:hypothetical protein